MTVGPPLEDDWIRRERSRAFYNGGLVTAIVVAAGAALAMKTMPPVWTPENAARAYTEASFARDWSSAWDLVCRQVRTAVGSYARYAETGHDWAEYYRLPSNVEVSVEDVHGIQGPGDPSAVVTVSVTSDEAIRPDWEIGGRLLLVQEEDGFRVCERGVLEA